MRPKGKEHIHTPDQLNQLINNNRGGCNQTLPLLVKGMTVVTFTCSSYPPIQLEPLPPSNPSPFTLAQSL